MASNLSRGIQWRELVAAILRADGHTSVTFKPGPVPLARAILDDVASDIRGVPGFAIITRNVLNRDLGQAMEDARAAAARDGAKHAAAIFRRHDAGAPSAYVVLELSDFSSLLRELEEVPR
jgi:hypothetical protein